jgi:putative DNA methylase
MEGVFSTDPPYYDNIGRADLSTSLCLATTKLRIYGHHSTILVPKSQELVATPYRFDDNKERAQQFFEERFAKAFAQMRRFQSPGIPLTVYYAFKQSESDEDEEDGTVGVASTGWETMLEGLVNSEFQVTGTWPLRSELSNRQVASGANALASSIVLACRPRADSAPITTRKDFLAVLKKELPWLCAISRKETSPLSISPKLPSVQGWPFFHALRECLKVTALQCESVLPWG